MRSDVDISLLLQLAADRDSGSMCNVIGSSILPFTVSSDVRYG